VPSDFGGPSARNSHCATFRWLCGLAGPGFGFASGLLWGGGSRRLCWSSSAAAGRPPYGSGSIAIAEVAEHERREYQGLTWDFYQASQLPRSQGAAGSATTGPASVGAALAHRNDGIISVKQSRGDGDFHVLPRLALVGGRRPPTNFHC